jgi:hypothetical protein
MEEEMATKGVSVHPALEYDEAIIEQAIRFDVSLFLGTGQYDKLSVTTLELACVAVKVLMRRNPGCTRRPIIYANSPDGRRAIVPV